jgi:hypothetical protein
MKRFAGVVSVLVLFAAPMFGSSKKPQNVVIPEKVQIGSTQLPAGNYKLAWTGDGPTVQATLSTRDGKTVVTFTAKATEAKNGNTAVSVKTDGGVSKLKTIFLNDLSLQIESAQ